MATCRYVINNGSSDRLYSKEFEGPYSLDDVAMSQYDAMSLNQADLPMLKAFLLRQAAPSLLDFDDSIPTLREVAWRAILRGRHERSAAIAVAKTVLAYDPTLSSNPHPNVTGPSISSGPTVSSIHGFLISRSPIGASK
ncbi:MAG: hypothetical protein JWO08_1336 [Verrucomicrobiaceae bacterium]|nr:hypothetical protein [Verrucomicrobiaceae bacterium]